MDLKDKDYRNRLIERYLNAETSVSEEVALAEFYATHNPDDDEKAFAQLISASHNLNVNLSDEDTAEYDRMVSMAGKERHLHWHRHLAEFVAAAAVVTLFFVLRPTTEVQEEVETSITTLEIADALNAVMSIDYDNIESVTAKPNGKTVIITAKMKDGSSNTYIMAVDGSNGGTTLFAWGN
mgnify:CR=1 FL=1